MGRRLQSSKLQSKAISLNIRNASGHIVSVQNLKSPIVITLVPLARLSQTFHVCFFYIVAE